MLVQAMGAGESIVPSGIAMTEDVQAAIRAKQLDCSAAGALLYLRSRMPQRLERQSRRLSQVPLAPYPVSRTRRHYSPSGQQRITVRPDGPDRLIGRLGPSPDEWNK
jgi:hypothetical protein